MLLVGAPGCPASPRHHKWLGHCDWSGGCQFADPGPNQGVTIWVTTARSQLALAGTTVDVQRARPQWSLPSLVDLIRQRSDQGVPCAPTTATTIAMRLVQRAGGRRTTASRVGSLRSETVMSRRGMYLAPAASGRLRSSRDGLRTVRIERIVRSSTGERRWMRRCSV